MTNSAHPILKGLEGSTLPPSVTTEAAWTEWYSGVAQRQRGLPWRFEVFRQKMVKFQGFNGDTGEAYYAHPLAAARYPSVVVIHHFPGWDEWTTEVACKFVHHGYAAIRAEPLFPPG